MYSLKYVWMYVDILSNLLLLPFMDHSEIKKKKTRIPNKFCHFLLPHNKASCLIHNKHHLKGNEGEEIVWKKKNQKSKKLKKKCDSSGKLLILFCRKYFYVYFKFDINANILSKQKHVRDNNRPFLSLESAESLPRVDMYIFTHAA